jgi:hypothetical protein
VAGRVDSSRVRVRPAELSDYDAIHALLMRMGQEMAPYEIDPARVEARIKQVLRFGVCFIAFLDYEPVGTIGLLAERASWFTNALVISDTWVYVDKHKRPLRVFDALKRECMAYAERAGLPLVFCLHTLVETDRKAKLFARHAETLMRAWRWQPMGGEYRVG